MNFVAFARTNLAFLSLFSLEVLLSIFAFGPISFLKSWLSCLDGVIVVATLALDVSLYATKSPAGHSASVLFSSPSELSETLKLIPSSLQCCTCHPSVLENLACSSCGCACVLKSSKNYGEKRRVGRLTSLAPSRYPRAPLSSYAQAEEGSSRCSYEGESDREHPTLREFSIL